jgi:hypothetical protein
MKKFFLPVLFFLLIFVQFAFYKAKNFVITEINNTISGIKIIGLQNDFNPCFLSDSLFNLSNQMMCIDTIIEVTTNTPVGRGNINEGIVAANVITIGTGNPLELTSLTFSLDGTTDISDIKQININLSFNSTRTSNSLLLKSLKPQKKDITIICNHSLHEGNNFIWVSADLQSTAKEGNYLAGKISSVTIDKIDYPVTPSAEKSNRLIFLEHKLLFSGGDYGSANFRIPALTTANDGSLIVAVDARVDRTGDLPNNIDIMYRRSFDQGNSWSDASVICDFGMYGASDPALVVDKKSGVILCMFASHIGLFHSTFDNPIRFQVCRREDNGVSWSKPVDHTNSIYAPGWYAAWLASGSAHQLRNGRIVGAIGVRQEADYTISNFMIYSDDVGLTWNYKSSQASAIGDEAKIMELDNGNLIMNIRNKTPNCRKIVVSEDGGDTWGAPFFQHELIDPAVNADFIRYTSVLDGYDKSRLLFSTASHPTTRKNLTLFMSYDEGVTWPVSKVIYEGLSGYSSLTILNDGTIGCAYENGEFEEYQIYFVRLSLDWLTDGKDSYQRPNDILRK